MWSQDSSDELLMRQMLEWELSLSCDDIRSHGWFHGCLNRAKAEQLLQNEGQFLVRNCSSRTGDYVLSCVHCGHHLHFVISKVILQPNTVYERVQYTFEDDYFDTITDLITFYVGNRTPISLASNAVITTPVNRTIPLSPLSTDFSTHFNTHLQSYKDKCLNKFNALDNNILIFNKSSTYDKNSLNCSGEEINESDCCPPPKPSRIPNEKHNNSLDEAVISDANINTSNTNCDTFATNGQELNQNGSHGSEDSAFYSDNISLKQNSDCDHNRRKCSQIDAPNNQTRPELTLPGEDTSLSLIRPQHFHTYLLPKDNKPLEATAITKIHSVLYDTGARILANHLTKCDLQFIKHLNESHDFGLGVESALELILLPHGQQMRSDLLERHQCFKYFIVITILTAINDQNRALIFNKWIEIAFETKTALGDLFGFTAIMEALSMEPIVKLKKLWAIVRKDHTQNAINYETKLRMQLKYMNECTEPQAPNTTFPFILTLVQILQRHSLMAENESQTNIQLASLNLGFEQTAVDYGLQQIYNHLEKAPQMVQQIPNYKRNGHIVLESCQLEELLCDMFRSEFHRQFLFGFRGSLVDSDQRFQKLDQIVMAFARKCEPDIDSY